MNQKQRDEVMRRGRAAQWLLESEQLQELFTEIQDHAAQAFLNSADLGDQAVREAHLEVQGVRAVEARLQWALSQMKTLEKAHHRE